MWGVGGMILVGKTQVVGEKHVTLPLHPRQIHMFYRNVWKNKEYYTTRKPKKATMI
jgi:hypothetical protein